MPNNTYLAPLQWIARQLGRVPMIYWRKGRGCCSWTAPSNWCLRTFPCWNLRSWTARSSLSPPAILRSETTTRQHLILGVIAPESRSLTKFAPFYPTSAPNQLFIRSYRSSSLTSFLGCVESHSLSSAVWPELWTSLAWHFPSFSSKSPPSLRPHLRSLECEYSAP